MPLIKTTAALKQHLSLVRQNGNLGLVPTMGALHEGHASLIKRATEENTTTVVTIFVNPTQFDNLDDLATYPNTLDTDLSLIYGLFEEIIVFAPSAEEVYGTEIKSKKYDFGGLEKVMEGTYRANHFNGVGTIVEQLLTLVQPNRAYFGEKDFQQLLIIKRMVAVQKIPVTIIGCPIVREENGLAMSSRNERLSKHARKEAAFIYKTLRTAKIKFGTKSALKVTEWVENQFKKHAEFELEYFMIADTEKLRPVKRKKPDTKYRAFIVVYAKAVRLIDNIALN